MAYNDMGDLYKVEIVERLSRMGYNIKNVHELNKIMEEMGLLRNYSNHWTTTDKGAKFTPFINGIDSPAWHPELIDEIVLYLDGR